MYQCAAMQLEVVDLSLYFPSHVDIVPSHHSIAQLGFPLCLSCMVKGELCISSEEQLDALSVMRILIFTYH